MNLAVELEETGVLKEHGVKLLGTSVETIQKGEDREKFRSLMNELNQPVPESEIVDNETDASVLRNPSVFLLLSDLLTH